MSKNKNGEEEEELTEEEMNIQMWRMQKIIKSLEEAKGNGTSMISLIVKPKTQVSTVAKMLAEEYGTASNIKSRVNRLSVLDAITSTQQKLKLFSRIPKNGLALFCGTILVGDNKTKKKTIAIEPFKPINTSLYLCDNKFHTGPMKELLVSTDKFGFVIMTGSECLFGTLSGSTKNIVHKFTVQLPKKHGRGGQSALRFARLRLEKRRNYLRKVAEHTTKFFIKNDKPSIKGLILAGSADFKSVLSKSDLFDGRLRRILLKIVDIPYGGEEGFTKAIELSQECLSNVKYVREKKIIDEFFTNISKDTGKYAFGIKNTVEALEMGVAKTLIVWENIDLVRYEIHQEDEDKIVYLSPNDKQDAKDFQNEDGTDYKFDKVNVLEWLCDNYKNFGCHIELVSDRSEQGSQFVQGFGGIGAILRYKVDLQPVVVGELSDDDDYDSDDDDLDDFI